jgi:uncharacterized protein VirK/YbjX
MIKRAKYCLRGLVLAPYTKEWFEVLRAPELAFIVKNHPALFQKLQRPYLNCTLGTTQRLEALKQHYKFVREHFSPAMIEEVYVPGGKLLAELSVKEVGTLELRLCCNRMQKEGDLTINLSIKESQQPIASLSFSVWKCEMGYKEIFVGGLQGDKATAEDVVVSITRGLYGLRPKALLVYMLQQLACCWKINRIRAVNDEMHIYRHFQSRRNVNASYDAFWVECGGTPVANGNFDLPIAFVPREISTIRVNKRQQYKRRYAMLAGIEEQIWYSLSGVGKAPMKGAGKSSAPNLATPHMYYMRPRAA